MGMWWWPLMTVLLVVCLLVRFELVSHRERQRRVARLRDEGRPQ